MDEDKARNAVAMGAAIAAAAARRSLLERGLQSTFRSDPPGHRAHRDAACSDALLWALSTGELVGVIRPAGQRAADSAGHRVTSDYPRLWPAAARERRTR